jgi:ubiquinone/menaquinone biosynthesis C-methylase UbiE
MLITKIINKIQARMRLNRNDQKKDICKEDEQKIALAPNHDGIYYQGIYWNDYMLVKNYINKTISGDDSKTWVDYVKDKFLSQLPFKHALSLNCGNGWVDRELYDKRIIENCIGYDYSGQLLREAESETKKRNLEYIKIDINEANFKNKQYDFIINHAACHHIAYLDKVLRKLCYLMDENGVFVNFDYIGPHRNQYSYALYNTLWETNLLLPKHLQQKLVYPHLTTMLVTDPSEAIHSELILLTVKRYFHIIEMSNLGGGIAYPLITHNVNMANAKNMKERDFWIKKILEIDKNYSDNPEYNLFSFFIAKPNKNALNDKNQLDIFSKEEEVRETTAVENGGIYYKKTLLQALTDNISDLHDVLNQAK